MAVAYIYCGGNAGCQKQDTTILITENKSWF